MVIKLAAAGGLLLLLVVITVISVVLGENEQQCAPAGAPGGGADEPGLSDMQVAVRVYEVGVSMGVPEKHLLAAFATVIVEAGGNTTMSNPMCNSPGECDRDSVGAFQQRNFSPWTDNGRNRRNVRDAARTFYEQAQRKDNSGLTPGQLAQAVQVSAFPEKYDDVLPRAREYLASVRALAPTQFARLAGGGAATTEFVSNPAAGGRTSESGLVWPTVKAPVSSPYGERWGRLHAGIDIAAPEGAPIYAAAGGVVTLSVTNFSRSGYGNNVCLRHAGRDGTFTTCYAHMLEAPRHPEGATVTQGEVIGRVGNTGHSFGAHLHFEVREGADPRGTPVDPAPHLDEDAVPTTPASTNVAACAPAQGVPVVLTGPLAWPLATLGELVGGGPNEPGSTHDPAVPPSGWQSDNALDISVPVGTPVLAVADGAVCSGCGIGELDSDNPQLAGLRLTLDAARTQFYYAHLSRIVVRPGQRVRRGQVIGYSGSANGVPHLHIAVRDGDPSRLFSQPADERVAA